MGSLTTRKRPGRGRARHAGRSRRRRDGHARPEKTPSGRPTFTTTSPDLVDSRSPHLRRHGGGPGPECGDADGPGRPSRSTPCTATSSGRRVRGSAVPPTSSRGCGTGDRSRTRAGRAAEVEGRETFRMTVLVPRAGGGRRVPAPGGIRRSRSPRDLAGFEAPFSVRRPGAGCDRASGGRHLRLDATLLVPHREPLPDDPAVHACVLAYFSDMTGAAFRPGSLGSLGDPYRRQPRPRRVVPPPLAGRRLELLRSAGAR